ncbi:MAG: YceI family protein [Meiothermus sp.]|uniref:YceI family protein n=1 Tax=Meiothermus sp. TaxID=1955249 RepID=UPI0025DA281E|nr:YceI family protein [Meiothermus sp.]MCS7058077.1 YceI family protein [Meiothermus sp.]MCS7194042.1 YceI family protein [Meiothermus sp.]MCX7740298.1 YceI family protein [Meiothermus sp.]MDW8091182.1 YceI family protein [Meiothermus sp.]MDW8480441.1 YceI family protein [Meiothermus sp.]
MNRWFFVLLGLVGLAQAQAQSRLELIPTQSEARYRVREQLAGLNFPTDAVGTSKGVQGVVRLDRNGRALEGSRFTVDLNALASDEPRRDNYIRRNTLNTGQYPVAEFVPKEVRGLSFPLPQSGKFPVQIVGDLKIREVSRSVTWEGEVEFRGDTAYLQARTSFTFRDFGLVQPRVLVVLSVDENIRLEVSFAFRILER